MRSVVPLTLAAFAFAGPALAQKKPPAPAGPTVGRVALPEPPAEPAPPPAPAPAPPPTIVQPAVGVTVFDPAGTAVGTISALDAQYATITTPKGDVKLPAAGVGPGQNGAVVGLTAAQIDAAVAQAAAATAAATAPAPAVPVRPARRPVRR